MRFGDAGDNLRNDGCLTVIVVVVVALVVMWFLGACTYYAIQ